MTTENISSTFSSSTSKIHHRCNKCKKTSENISPTNTSDWSKYFPNFILNKFYFIISSNYFLYCWFCLFK